MTQTGPHEGGEAPEAVSIRPAAVGDALAIAELLRASITDLCVLDHGGSEERLGRSPSNKTADDVSRWVDERADIMLIATIGGISPASVA